MPSSFYGERCVQGTLRYFDRWTLAINLAMLTLLDLSTAFDSVDRNIFLYRLQTSYGLAGCHRLVHI